jgi:hypothetical protein
MHPNFYKDAGDRYFIFTALKSICNKLGTNNLHANFLINGVYILHSGVSFTFKDVAIPRWDQCQILVLGPLEKW